MTRETLRRVVLEAIKQETGHDSEHLQPDHDIRRQVELDSMQFVAIVAKVEALLKTELPAAAFFADTIDDFVRAVEPVVCHSDDTDVFPARM
jgi:acyl carrier protein